MGLFGSSSETYVSSVVYNMAGDVNKRSNYLKATVLSSMIGEADASIGDTIRSAYLKGPGIQFRSFARWAAGSSGYSTTVGFTSGQIVTGNSIDTNKLIAQLNPPLGYSVALTQTDMGYADITWWAEQYILSTHPTKINTNWHADYLNGQAVITYADGTKESFTPTGFDPDQKYLFAAYTLNSGQVVGATVTGTAVDVTGKTFPDSTGWTLLYNQLTPQTVTLANGSSVTALRIDQAYQKDTYLGIDAANPARTHATRQLMYMTQNPVASGNAVVLAQAYRIDTQDVTVSTSSGLKVFIYPSGSGNAVLDAMFAPPANMGTFFPYIPIRIDNQMVSPTYQPAVYAAAKKAYKKATNGNFDDVVDQINDNDSIGDIDYAYVVFGVSANVTEVASKKYIFAFFEAIMDSASFTPHAYARFKINWAAADASHQTADTWVAQHGQYGSAQGMPAVTPYPALPTQSIEIKTSNTTNLNFDMRISWNGVEPSFGSGMKDPAHAVGDIWWTVNGADTFSSTVRTSSDPTQQSIVTSFQVPNVTLYWQVDDNNWKALTIYGLLHQNFVYDGKSVDISITDALKDTEESGFIIPLHEEIYKSMRLIDATQMATASCYLVFNCYQVVKKKWWQSGFFAIIVIVAIVVVTYFTAGASSPLVAGYAALGAAVGFTGLAAVLAGLAISMVSAMVLAKLLGVVASAAFGEKVGAIVGAIATVVITTVGANLANGATWTTALSQLTSPNNLTQLTLAVGKGVTQFTALETQDVINQTNQMLDDYNAKMDTVSDAYATLGASNLSAFDPLSLTDVGSTTGSQHTYEPSSSFLSRTLMTGSDIAELNSALISQFTSLTLDPNQTLVT